ncbi:hypothetical protein BC332_34101 [Capsicum chinense]|nr:hypothetical protein BC332_34101 [Capsicum chinense]
MLSSMTGPAAAGTITPVTVTGGDDGIPPDLLLQSETYISAEMNARFKTAKSYKTDFVVEEGKEVDLATPVSVESKSKMEVQMTKSVAETVTPVHKVNRSVEVNVKRPSWLSEDWKFERKFCTNGASAGTVENKSMNLRLLNAFKNVFSVERLSGFTTEVLRFLKTGSMRKKSTGGNATILGHLLFMATWFLKTKDKNGMLSSRLCLKGMQIGMQHRDVIVVDGFLLWHRNRQKVLHLNSVHDVQVWSELRKQLLMLALG